MPFIFFGLFLILSGAFFLVVFGIKKKCKEMKNGSIALILAGIMLVLWGMMFIFTGNI